MQTKLFSIIVPIYKVEKYLHKCVNSLVNQTYKDIEIVLVDDGSPDNCPQICDEYAAKDKRINVIHKKNGGLSDARNVGLENCTGEYVLFVDSDDYIELDACEKFTKIIGSKKPDIVVGNAIKLVNDKKMPMSHTYINNSSIISGKDYLKHELKNGTMHMAAWLNMYRVEFLNENNFKFKEGLLHEDEQFTPRVFLKAERVIATDIVFYNYLIRDGSITTSKNKVKNALHLIETCKELEKTYSQVEDKNLRELLEDSLVNKFLNAFQIGGLHKKKYTNLVDGAFLKGKALTKRNKLKVSLFLMNRKVYFYTNRTLKKIEDYFKA